MTNQEKRIIANVIKRLNGGRSSDEVRQALTGPTRLYLQTWVLSALELMIKPNRTRRDIDLADDLAAI